MKEPSCFFSDSQVLHMMHIRNILRLSWGLKPVSAQRTRQSIRCVSSSPRLLANDFVSTPNPHTSLGDLGRQVAPPRDAEKDLIDYTKIHLAEQCHHLHIISHKRNTHLTLSNQKRGAIISVSTGNLGFRKAKRGTYDAAFQLAAYLFTRMQREGLGQDIGALEIIYRGWGAGREAVTKALLGVEGMVIRDKVVRVMDRTRVKFGGTRSPKPRRLG